jgi:hypothetical protein
MTVALGFQTGDAAILCADSQEVVSDYSKTTTQKIRTTTYHNNWRLGVVGSAEDAPYLDAFHDELQEKLGKIREYNYSKITRTIKERLRDFYKKHVWVVPKDDRPYLQMLIVVQGIKPNGARALLYTQKDLVLPVQGYRSIGIGMHMADYLCRRLDVSGTGIASVVYNSSTEEMAKFGVYVLDQVKSAIHGCDGETLVAVFHGDGSLRWLLGVEVDEIESWFTRFHASELPLFKLVSSPETGDEEFERRLKQFDADMRLLRARQSQDAQTQAERLKSFFKAQAKAAPPKRK